MFGWDEGTHKRVVQAHMSHKVHKQHIAMQVVLVIEHDASSKLQYGTQGVQQQQLLDAKCNVRKGPFVYCVFQDKPTQVRYQQYVPYAYLPALLVTLHAV